MTSTVPSVLTGLSGLLLSLPLAATPAWDNDANGIKVFILADQSNMVGYGKTEDGGNPA